MVTFGDSGIAQNVQTDLGVTDSVTLGDLRHFTGTTLNIGTVNTALPVTGTLAGMQYLQALPQTAKVSLYMTYPSANLDLSPLMPVHFSQLSLMIHDMGQVNLAPLKQVDPSDISLLQIYGSTRSDLQDYQQNANGLTNAQLAQLGPWLTAINEAGHNTTFNFNDNSLTDFSPLKNFTKPAIVTGLGQRVNLNAMPVNFVVGQPGVFTATPLTGLQGEDLTSHYQSTWNNYPTQTTMAQSQELFLTPVSGHEFKIATAYPTIPDANWFAYGLRGYYHFETTADYPNFIMLTYPNGVTFNYDVMVYQPANWLPAPEVYVRYLDGNTGQALRTATVTYGTNIGDSYNLSQQAQLANYQLDTTRSAPLTGTYTQDPQYLTMTYTPEVAGGITVNYLDEAGHAIAPATQLTGNVGTAYTATPATVAGYTAGAPLMGSLPVSGTLPLAAGEISYSYTPNTLTRTIQYLDTTTGQVLKTQTVTGPYLSTANYQPTTQLDQYLADGYRLVANPYSATAAFTTPEPTATYQIELAHQLTTLTPTTPDLPSDVDLTHTVIRTIQYQDLFGETLAPSTQQAVTFTRTATRDDVTGTLTYTPWQAVGTSDFAAQPVPEIDGYLPEMTTVPAVAAITATSPDVTTTAWYQGIPESAPQEPQEPQGTPTTPSTQPTQPTTDTTTTPTAPSTQPTIDTTTTPTTTPTQPTLGQVIVITVGPEGTPLRPVQTLQGPLTTPYQITAPKLAGYRLTSPTTITGTYTATPKTVRLVYAANATGSTTAVSQSPTAATSTTTSTATEPATGTAATQAKTLTATPTAERLTPQSPRLPQTAEHRSTTSRWGWLLLGLTGLLASVKGWFRRVKD